MKRIIRRIVTVVTTETWSVVEDDGEAEQPSLAEFTSQWSLPEGSGRDSLPFHRPGPGGAKRETRNARMMDKKITEREGTANGKGVGDTVSEIGEM